MNPDLFPNVENYPVEGLPVDVTFSSGGRGHLWHFVTDVNGKIVLDGIPTGSYNFNWSWNGVPDSELLSICCAKRDWVFENWLDAKGSGAT